MLTHNHLCDPETRPQKSKPSLATEALSVAIPRHCYISIDSGLTWATEKQSKSPGLSRGLCPPVFHILLFQFLYTTTISTIVTISESLYSLILANANWEITLYSWLFFLLRIRIYIVLGPFSRVNIKRCWTPVVILRTFVLLTVVSKASGKMSPLPPPQSTILWMSLQNSRPPLGLILRPIRDLCFVGTTIHKSLRNERDWFSWTAKHRDECSKQSYCPRTI